MKRSESKFTKPGNATLSAAAGDLQGDRRGGENGVPVIATEESLTRCVVSEARRLKT